MSDLDIEQIEQKIKERLSALSDPQRVDAKRRRDVCFGVTQAATSLLVERRRVRQAIEADKKAETRRAILVYGGIAAGIALNWFLMEEGKGFQFTLGALIAVAAALWGVGLWWRRERLRQEFVGISREVNVLLAMWMGAGADGSDFWSYSGFSDAETGEIDWGSERCRRWWREVQLSLLLQVAAGY